MWGVYTGIPEASWNDSFVANLVIKILSILDLGLASSIYPSTPSTLYVAFSSVAHLSRACLCIASPKLDT